MRTVAEKAKFSAEKTAGDKIATEPPKKNIKLTNSVSKPPQVRTPSTGYPPSALSTDVAKMMNSGKKG